MRPLDLHELQQYSDVLRLRSGDLVTVRFVEPRDAEALQNYFRSLSARSRYNRLMGAASELPQTQLEKFVHAGEGGSFSVVATRRLDGADTIVGDMAASKPTATPSVRRTNRAISLYKSATCALTPLCAAVPA